MPDERTPDIRDRLPNDVGPDFSAANAPVEIPPLPVDAPEEANEIYTRLIEAEKPSLEEAISLLHHSEAQDEILAVPEIREAALRAYGKAMTQIRSMDDLEFCGSLQTAFLIEEHPEELEAERIAGYLDSIRTGDLELILRSEVLLLGGVEIPIEPLHAAIEEAYLAALRREEPVGEGSPIETLSRFFQYSVDPERLAEITASERIGSELSKQIEEALLEGRIRKLRQLSDDSSLAMDPREDPTFEDMRVQGLIQVLSRGQSDLAKEILRTWALPDDVQIRPEVRSAASSVFNMPNATVAEMVGMTELFPTLVKGTSESESSRMVLDALKQAGLGASQNSHLADWERLSPLFISVPELQGDPELQAAAVEIEVKPLLMKGKRDQAESISEKWEFSLQAVLEGLSPEERSKAFVATVAHGSLFEARELREALQVNSEDLQGETIAAALKGRIATEFESSIVSAREWIDAFPELAESLPEIAVNAFSNALLSSRVQRAVDLLELPELQVPGLRPSGVLGTVFANQEFSSLDEMRKFAEEEPSYLRTLAQMTNPPLLSRKDLEQVKKLGISAVDGELARQSDVALDAMNNDSDYQRLYDAI
ncbi:MAG: hypothetical protein KDD70_15400, partial [Bdellovibrionales bacterium]|nr:hypothetical protein [Bdellovibrionales bacterium]